MWSGVKVIVEPHSKAPFRQLTIIPQGKESYCFLAANPVPAKPSRQSQVSYQILYGVGYHLTSIVAEAMKKPLYSMGAGELGNDAAEVEQNLRRVLDLSTKWGAVLLLDECDVFLERRTTHDLQRNKLVSVFLRLLEYYQGVMFLTTNRVASFDPAFESRIHLTIHYPQLDFDSRLHVWRIFVKPGSASSSVSEQELEALARPELNGRQIKNIVKTARLLAARDKTPLTLGQLKTVLTVKGVDVTITGKALTNGA